MEALVKAVRAFWRDQSGATSIEYSIMASCIAVAVVAAVNALGSAVMGNYTSVSTALNK
jgi:pilus assembly protein Flp/PilA